MIFSVYISPLANRVLEHHAQRSWYMFCSTFGNDLEPTSNWLEVIFSICIVLSGLMLFTLLIGNIQVPLFSFTFAGYDFIFPNLLGYMENGPKLRSELINWCRKGIFARGHGKEEENAAEMPRYGVVDEAETVAVSVEAKSPPL